jgi:hypothetical protein
MCWFGNTCNDLLLHSIYFSEGGLGGAGPPREYSRCRCRWEWPGGPCSLKAGHMERKMNMQQLAESFGDITTKEYLHCAMDIMSDKI